MREDRSELSEGMREEGTCRIGSFVMRDLKNLTASMRTDKAFCWILILMPPGMLALEVL
jgi:hypothetical protein